MNITRKVEQEVTGYDFYMLHTHLCLFLYKVGVGNKSYMKNGMRSAT